MFFNRPIRFAQRSPRWASVRKEHLRLYPNCAACGSLDTLEVHHIIPVHMDLSRELDPTNLITLCAKPCHLVFGHFMNYKSWNIDVVEDCRVYYNKLRNKPIKV